jgi:SAM-dependent methyltransferase
MAGTIDAEIAFLSRAVAHYGPAFLEHVRTKGFSSSWFLSNWAAVTEIINRHGLGPRVLDLGCGPGWTSLFLAGRGFQVTAGDVAPDMLDVARQNAERLGLDVDFRKIDMQRPLPRPDTPYDLVLILDALHHMPDERIVLRNCLDVLRPGGSILLVEPDWFHEFSPGSIRARRDFGTTERGMGFGRMKRSLRAAGFVRPRRYFSLYAYCGGGPWQRLKALGTAALTLTVGFPHRSVIALAERP